MQDDDSGVSAMPVGSALARGEVGVDGNYSAGVMCRDRNTSWKRHREPIEPGRKSPLDQVGCNVTGTYRRPLFMRQRRLRSSPPDLSGSSRAAVYLRMSTDHQRYSIANQSEALAKYAIEHGLQIVEAYADEGRSGLTIRGRPALQSLINDVQLVTRPFDVLLVLDVSRWGRFQNADEAAHYEFICWSSGVEVVYCAEGFKNDGSPMSSILKGMKRVMAGEYSRDLSRRIVAAKLHKAMLGFHQGGRSPYGLCRTSVDRNGTVRTVLGKGEQKPFFDDHVRLGYGPADEVDVVRRMFRYFVRDHRTVVWIARRLNAEGIVSPNGKIWRYGSVQHILRNEAYTGCSVYNRTAKLMKGKKTFRDGAEHVRHEESFPAIVPKRIFEASVARFSVTTTRYPTAVMLDSLRTLFAREGKVTCRLVNLDRHMASANLYDKRFGSLAMACAAAGLPAKRDNWFRYDRTVTAGVRRSLLKEAIAQLTNAGHPARQSRDSMIHINETISIMVATVTPRPIQNGTMRWKFRRTLLADFYLLARLDADQTVLGFHLFPTPGLSLSPICLYDQNGEITDAHGFETMAGMPSMLRRLLNGEIVQPLKRFGLSFKEATASLKDGQASRSWAAAPAVAHVGPASGFDPVTAGEDPAPTWHGVRGAQARPASKMPLQQTRPSAVQRFDGGSDSRLSKRETDVVRLLAEGLTVSEIAGKVVRSRKTISTQKVSAMKKLGLGTDMELFRYALAKGFVKTS
jgi:DNA invertase Pin-like site-specific DNA recombinase/DNA-binding CsgD family transcriptional regulator